MRKHKKHHKYFGLLIVLMLFTLLLTSTLLFSIGKISAEIGFVLVVLCAVITGLVSYKVIKKTRYSDKREILAGSIIPLPTIIGIIIYLVILENIRMVEAIDALWASAAFFIIFNIPFLADIYEHDKHKHHLVGFIFAPFILIIIYVFAFFTTQFIASDFIKPQVIDSFAVSYEIAPVRNYVDNCIRTIGKEAIEKNADIKQYFDENLDNCIESFAPFEDLEIKSEPFTSSVVYGDNTITISINYPIIITENDVQYKISDFQTILSR